VISTFSRLPETTKARSASAKFMTGFVLAIGLMTLGSTAAPVWASAITEKAQSLIQSEQALDAARLAAFQKDARRQQSLLNEAKEALSTQEARADDLREAFAANEQRLAEQSEALRLRTGNLGEMFGVVRQVAGDVDATISDSLTRIDGAPLTADLAALSQARELPELTQIEALWQTLRNEAAKAAEITPVQAPVILPDGQSETTTVVRVGTFNVLSAEGYLLWDDALAALRPLASPSAHQDSAKRFFQQTLAESSSGLQVLALDPSRGTLLNLQSDSPNWMDRIQQGGTVGYIIIVLGVIGLVLALWRLLYLQGVVRGVNKQLASPASPTDDNPLGRVLAVGLEHRAASVAELADADLVEAKIDEAVLRELPAIERGQSLIKLLAGIAPLLGLLGTVTGMIATFQAITVYGSGDAKLMAAGISQALMTTVLGLVVAVPMLLLHSWVSSRSRAVVQVLDEQAAGILAQAKEVMSGQSAGGQSSDGGR